MSKIKSIITVDFPALLGRYKAQIEDLTRGKVVAIMYDDHRIRFDIEHHEGPVCPECGEAIHNYGHGLCLKCWTEFRKNIRG